MKKTILIISLFTAILFSQKLSAQSYDGAGDNKIFLGLTQIGSNTGVESTYDIGWGDLVSTGGKITLLFDNSSVSQYGESAFGKFFSNTDFSVFLRFHLSIPLNLSEKLDPYFGLDGSFNSIGAHAGIKYNFSETLGMYAQFSQGFSKLFFGSDYQNKFANKTALSAGITVNM